MAMVESSSLLILLVRMMDLNIFSTTVKYPNFYKDHGFMHTLDILGHSQAHQCILNIDMQVVRKYYRQFIEFQSIQVYIWPRMVITLPIMENQHTLIFIQVNKLSTIRYLIKLLPTQREQWNLHPNLQLYGISRTNYNLLVMIQRRILFKKIGKMVIPQKQILMD